MGRKRRRFCVKCGTLESPDNPIVDGLCLKCMVEEKPLFEVKNKRKLVVCPICSSYLVENSWVKGTGDVEETLRMLALRAIEEGLRPLPPAERAELLSAEVVKRRGGRYFAEVTVEVTVKGAKVVQTSSVPLEVKKRPCPKCLMKSGKDYGAVLQIRSESGKVTPEELRAAGELFAKVGSGEDVVELVDQKNGLDVLLVNKEIAKRAAQLMRFNMGAKVIESYSVVGMRRDGKVRTRLTISVRLPRVRGGEGLLFFGEPAIFEGFSRGKFFLYLLHSNKELKLPTDEWWQLRKSGKIKYLDELYLKVGTVESEEPLRVNVGGEVVDAEGPPDLARGEEVYIIEYKGKVYALPKEPR